MEIIIHIELLVFLVIFFMFIFFSIWKKLSNRRALKKYKPENDKGRLAEEKRRRDIESAKDAISSSGLAESTERSSISSAVTSIPREDSSGTRKANGRFRNPFRRRQ